MRHFDITQWADFVRGLTPAGQHTTMEQHLAGCERCASVAAVLGRIVAAAAIEPSFEPSSALVTAAQRVFVPLPQSGASGWLGLRRLAARLTYDSRLDIAPAGVRSGRSASRQVMYHAGQYCVDLRLDGEMDGPLVTLIGQIADEATPEIAIRNVPIFLFSGKKEIARTISNEFGEFCIDYAPKRNVRLCVPLEDAGAVVELSLNPLKVSQ